MIVNRIKECAEAMPGKQYERRLVTDIDTVLVHRIDPEEMGRNLGISIEMSSVGLSAAFTDPRTKIGKMAYSILVKPDGVVEQALPLSYVSPHGKRWNFRAVGVAFMGNFTHEEPTDMQVTAGKWVLRLLVQAFCPPSFTVMDKDGKIYPCLMGHTEAPGSFGDPTKVCPGQYLPMDELRQSVLTGLCINPTEHLDSAGLVF